MMEELIVKLNELYASEASVVTEDGVHYFSEDEKVVSDVVGMACTLLIANGGSCNWDNINVLRNSGFMVFRGDGDSFGWLTGCIKKSGDDRILVYG